MKKYRKITNARLLKNSFKSRKMKFLTSVFCLLTSVSFSLVSLAVLNLLPVPLLDGGHLMFFTYEAIFGPISMKKKERAQLAGLLLLSTLTNAQETETPVPLPYRVIGLVTVVGLLLLVSIVRCG